MTLNVDVNAIDTAFLALITGDATVIANAVGGVFFGVNPDGAKDPFIVVSVASDLARFSLGQTNLSTEIIYLVRVVADGHKAPTRAGVIANAIDAALNFSSLTVSGLSNMKITRNGSGQRYADTDGFYNYATYYKVFASK